MNLETGKLENQSGTPKKHNKKTVKELITNLNEGLFDIFLGYLKQNEPNIKRILDIPEFKYIKLKKITEISTDKIGIKFELKDFKGSLRQILLKNGFNKNQFQLGEKHITLYFYGADLIIDIDKIE